MSTRYLLAADIGGTNSRFALFRLEDDAPAGAGEGGAGGRRLILHPQSRVNLSTPAQADFGQLLESLRRCKAPGGFSLLGDFNLAGLSLAVPGPVSGKGGKQVCRAPNIAWPILASEARRFGGAPASLLNDFAAQGLACLIPEAQGLQPVLPGRPDPAAPLVVVGAGTGLGKAVILPGRAGGPADPLTGPPTGESAAAVRLPRLGSRAMRARFEARILPSEGGHSLFPFTGPEEAAFQAFLLKTSGRREVIGDMVVSGGGLAALYAYHKGLSRLPSPPEAGAALSAEPEIGVKALDWLARFYGRACRNLVLETLALGGVRLTGGLLANVPGLLGHPAFAAEFRGSETHAATLQNVPVWWASNQDSGLWGAALHGVSRLRD